MKQWIVFLLAIFFVCGVSSSSSSSLYAEQRVPSTERQELLAALETNVPNGNFSKEERRMNQQKQEALQQPEKSAPRVLAISSSSKEDSINNKLLIESVEYLKTRGIQAKYLRLRDELIPIYHADDESVQGAPESAKRFRQALVDSDWILIASPEHNYSVSAGLKNAIDWASRDGAKPSRAAFQNKKWIFLSASPGPQGGVNGLKHLREIITGLKGDVYVETFSLPNAYSAFGTDGHLTDPVTREKLQAYLDGAFSPILVH